MNIKQDISLLLSRHLEMSPDELLALVETPPQEDLGDYAFPCFKLAKTLRKAPQQIAMDLAETLRSDLPAIVERVEATGPYVNFFLSRAAYAQAYFAEYDPADPIGGERELGQDRRIIMEYSSPNIAKPFHVGHACSTLIGDALARLFGYCGYDVIRLNHLGDYGTQFGKLIVAWKRWGSEEALEKTPIEELTRVYVKFHQEAEHDPELEQAGREAFRLLEEGDPEAVALWQRFRAMSLKAFQQIYDRLGVSFDNYNGESFYSDKIPAVVETLKEKGLLEFSEGAQVVMLDDYKLNPCLILKSDGTTIYASRDIAAVLYRDQVWDFDQNIYVVGLEQSNHFKQVFAVLERMGFPKARQCVHVGFGRVKMADGALSTRQGKVILLNDLLAESVAKVKSIIVENQSIEDPELLNETAEKIGLAAVKYTYLRNGREKDILFSWDEMLDFEGDSAPYLLYTYARTQSILRKSGLQPDPRHLRAELLNTPEDFTLLKQLKQCSDCIVEALRTYEPCVLLRHCVVLARSFNRYYHHHKILAAGDPELVMARLGLLQVFAETLKQALGLLGISCVERM